jgi:hypothetical protein
VRVTIDLEDHQAHWLNAICEREGVSPAEKLLSLVDEARNQSFEKNMSAVFGIWKHRGIDALEYERKLRAEWDRDVWKL